MNHTPFILLFALFSQFASVGQDKKPYEKGRNEFVTGNYRAAIDDLKVSAKIDNTGDVNYLLAMSYLNLKEFKNAVPYFAKEIKLNKRNYNAYIQKAYCNKLSGNFKDAAQTLKDLIFLNPQYFIAYSERAEISVAEKKYQSAIDDYKKALELNPRFEKALFKMGFCYLNLKDTANACNSWKKIEDLDDFEGYEKAEAIINKYKRTQQ